MATKGQPELYVSISKGSFEAIFSTYYPLLFSYAVSIVKDQDAAKDILQDVFLKLWNNRDRISVTSSLRSYLLRMTHNQCIDSIRGGKLGNRVSGTGDILQRLEVLDIKTGDGIFDKIYSDQLQSRLAEAVDTLPAQCKKIFLMNRQEGKSYLEIAAQLGVSHSTVKNQMMIAMRKLHEILKGLY